MFHYLSFNPNFELLDILLTRKFWILTLLHNVNTHPCLRVANISNLIGQNLYLKNLDNSFELVICQKCCSSRWPGLRVHYMRCWCTFACVLHDCTRIHAQSFVWMFCWHWVLLCALVAVDFNCLVIAKSHGEESPL